MVTSKKDARKSKAAAPKVKAAKAATPVAAESDEESEESEDEEENGVSEEGLKRLMELVNEEDLDEFELAALGGEEDEEEDDEEDGEEDGSAEDDEEMESGDGDEAPLDNTILDEQAEDDAISLDGLGSDVSVDEDAVPLQKITINNKPAMRTVTDAMRVTNMAWPEHLVINSKEVADVDPSDDLQRETAFYKIALSCVPQAKKLANKHDIPFTRPGDYYAEMVKSDEHMERVRSKLVDEAQGIKKSEAAKKQRDLKKFGKQIQHEKLRQREQDKKSFDERVQGLKRKRKEGMDIGEDGDNGEFDIAVDDAIEGRPERGGAERGGRGGRGKPKVPRHVRDSKYSLGGGGKRSKQNTRESTMDFGGGGGRGGRGGGRGGARGGSRGAAARGGRPGKSRRMAGRV